MKKLERTKLTRSAIAELRGVHEDDPSMAGVIHAHVNTDGRMEVLLDGGVITIWDAKPQTGELRFAHERNKDLTAELESARQTNRVLTEELERSLEIREALARQCRELGDQLAALEQPALQPSWEIILPCLEMLADQAELIEEQVSSFSASVDKFHGELRRIRDTKA